MASQSLQLIAEPVTQEFLPSQICIDERNQAYKSLVQDIAERLGQDEVNAIVFQRSLPFRTRQLTGLDLLIQLERDGLFSPGDIEPMADLLRKIHRCDLVTNFIEGYLQRYATSQLQGMSPERHSSLPSQKSPRMTQAKDRSLSLPAGIRTGVNGMLSAVQETAGLVDASPTQHIIHSNGQVPADHLLEDEPPRPLPNLQSAPRIPYTQEFHEQDVHCGLKHQPHSYPHMELGRGDSQDYYQTSPVHGLFSEESAPYDTSHTYHTNEPRTRHLSDRPNSFFHPQRASTPQLPFEDHRRKTSLPQQYYLDHQQSYSRVMTPGGTTPGSISGSSFSSLHDRLGSHTHSPSFHSSSELLTRHGSLLGQSSSSDVHQSARQQQQRKGHSLDHSYRCQPTPYLLNPATLPQNHVLAEEYRTQLQPDLDAHVRTDAFVQTLSSETPVQPLSHQQLPSNFEYSRQPPSVMRVRATNQLPSRSMTPPPQYPSGDHRLSGQLYATKSETRIPQAYSAQGYFTPDNHSLPLSHYDSGLVMPHRGNTSRTQLSAASSMGESIKPWMSASNDHLSQLQSRQSTGVQTEHYPDEPPLSPPLPKDDEGSVKSESPVNSSRKTDPQAVCSPKAKPRHWKLPLTRKHSRDTNLQWQWQLKRNVLNKAIYKHKASKHFTCPEKLEVGAGSGGKANPRLIFKLYPYGLEDDTNTNATLQVEIEVPKKCPRLSDSTRIRLTVAAYDVRESTELSGERVVTKPANLRDFLIPAFFTHDDLKNSHSDHIEIRASAKLLSS